MSHEQRLALVAVVVGLVSGLVAAWINFREVSDVAAAPIPSPPQATSATYVTPSNEPTPSESSATNGTPSQPPPTKPTTSGTPAAPPNLSTFVDQCQRGVDVLSHGVLMWPERQRLVLGAASNYQAIIDVEQADLPPAQVIHLNSQSIAMVSCTVGARLVSIDRTIFIHPAADKVDAEGWSYETFSDGPELQWSWTETAKRTGDHDLRLELRPRVVEQPIQGQVVGRDTPISHAPIQVVTSVVVDEPSTPSATSLAPVVPGPSLAPTTRSAPPPDTGTPKVPMTVSLTSSPTGGALESSPTTEPAASRPADASADPPFKSFFEQVQSFLKGILETSVFVMGVAGLVLGAVLWIIRAVAAIRRERDREIGHPKRKPDDKPNVKPDDKPREHPRD